MTVAVTIVTFNSARFIAQCLKFVMEQDYPGLEIVVVDNASSDGTAAILKQFESKIKVVYNQQNLGFAGGQNQAMSLSNADWWLVLNPDVRLTPNFVSTLIAAGEADPEIGSVCGKFRKNPFSIRPASFSPPICAISTAAANCPIKANLRRPSTSSAQPARPVCTAAR